MDDIQLTYQDVLREMQKKPEDASEESSVSLTKKMEVAQQKAENLSDDIHGNFSKYEKHIEELKHGFEKDKQMPVTLEFQLPKVSKE